MKHTTLPLTRASALPVGQQEMVGRNGDMLKVTKSTAVVVRWWR
jgi:hypothetical protein